MAVPTEKARKSGKRNDFVTMMTHYYKSAEKNYRLSSNQTYRKKIKHS